MDILVEYKNRSGVISNHTYNITRLQFAKHLAVAGQGYSPRPQKLLRTIGMFFHYSKYLQNGPFNNNRFSEPPIQLSDPTEKGQFSNLAGKAIADFLSKRIDGSLLTVNYEAAMRLRKMSLNVGRPDLLAYSQNSMFALEAKGYTGGAGNMQVHKAQSQTGGINVNFTVACVSYNLYNKVRCKYHDPYNDEVPYDFEGLKELSKKYYSGLAGFLNEEYFYREETRINGESFYMIDLPLRELSDMYEFDFRRLDFFDHYRLQIILPSNIEELAEHGISKDMKPFNFESMKDNNIYIDNDRVGLKIDRR